MQAICGLRERLGHAVLLPTRGCFNQKYYYTVFSFGGKRGRDGTDVAFAPSDRRFFLQIAPLLSHLSLRSDAATSSMSCLGKTRPGSTHMDGWMVVLSVFVLQPCFERFYIPYLFSHFIQQKPTEKGGGITTRILGGVFEIDRFFLHWVLVYVEVFSVPFYLMGFFGVFMGFALNGGPTGFLF